MSCDKQKTFFGCRDTIRETKQREKMTSETERKSERIERIDKKNTLMKKGKVENRQFFLFFKLLTKIDNLVI